ncbi:hypothetical protein LXL04_004559 [Taraxacum kok-saghyz]
MGIQGLLALMKSVMVPIHIKDLEGCSVDVELRYDSTISYLATASYDDTVVIAHEPTIPGYINYVPPIFKIRNVYDETLLKTCITSSPDTFGDEVKEARVWVRVGYGYIHKYPIQILAMFKFQQDLGEYSEMHQNIIVIKASMCCDDRLDLLIDMIQTLKSLQLSPSRLEMVTVGGRIRNIVLMECDYRGDDCNELVHCLKEALSCL